VDGSLLRCGILTQLGGGMPQREDYHSYSYGHHLLFHGMVKEVPLSGIGVSMTRKRAHVNCRLPPHSYLSAATGTSVAARSAGYNPDASPMSVANANANSSSQGGVTTATEGGGPPLTAVCPAR